MTETTLLVKMVLDRWDGSILSLNKLLDTLSDAQLEKEVAPGKNRGTYLLGHLIAVHDDMLVLLGIGERQFPELQEPFLKQPDRAVAQVPAAAVLRAHWNSQCVLLKEKFAALSPGQWFERHTAVSEEDFLKEPHRNKLNIIISRTSHLQYHSGQLVLLK